MSAANDIPARSWVESANRPGTDFPLRNLPFGVFTPPGEEGPPRIGVAIGDRILDLAGCVERGWLAREPAEAACVEPDLNALMALGPEAWSRLRRRLLDILREGSPRATDPAASALLVPRESATMRLPARIGDYTDFYASIHHATNVGRLFRPDNPLLPNYRWVPIGYHGRASSIVPSGTPVRRPAGQTKPPDGDQPAVGPSRRLDYECELGVFIGRGNGLGEPIEIGEAGRHIFGICLVNDWSARDIQAWEYQPLGPFLAKSFATTLSPWVVTMEALEPFRVPLAPRAPGDPAPLPYLDDPEDGARGGIDLHLEVWLSSAAMREQGHPPTRLSRANARDLYWTFAQMLTHHASNGCNLRPGDLFASGTVSGPDPDSGGCLLELTAGGSRPISLPTGEQRTFLEDGDEVTLRGYCERDGVGRVGLGECRGVVMSYG